MGQMGMGLPLSATRARDGVLSVGCVCGVGYGAYDRLERWIGARGGAAVCDEQVATADVDPGATPVTLRELASAGIRID